MDARSKRICLAQAWTQLSLCLAVLATTVVGFQPSSGLQQPIGRWSTTSRTTSTVRQLAAVDPNDLVNFAHHHPTLDAVLSTLYSTTADGLLQPAHGHSQPFFGAPDPWLSSGHSIAPNLKALGIDATVTPKEQLPEAAQAALQKGWKVVDAAKFQAGGGSTLPGFKQTGGILPEHSKIPEVTMASFTNQAFVSAKFLKVVEKLPMAAFVYVLIDFFLLRPNVDLYKEDIEEEPLEVAAETVAVSGIRLGVFFLIGFLTVVLFG